MSAPDPIAALLAEHRFRKAIAGMECTWCMDKITEDVGYLKGGSWKLGAMAFPLEYHWSQYAGKGICFADVLKP